MLKYNVILVDDEDVICEKIANLPIWNKYGFDVVATLDDGQTAIEYLKCNTVHVVMTDIKMTFVSGIELAKHIKDNYPNILVVLLSGYEDFKYAQQAINYNVKSYLIKPIFEDDLVPILEELKKSLDQNIINIEKNENLYLLYNDFFVNIGLSIYSSSDMITQQAKRLGIWSFIENKHYAVLQIEFNKLNEYLETRWNYGSNTFQNAALNILNLHNPNANYHLMEGSGNIVTLFCVYSKEIDFESNLSNVLTTLREFLIIDFTYKIIATFTDIIEFKNVYETYIMPNDMSKIIKQHLMLSIIEEDIEISKIILNKLIKSFDGQSFTNLKNTISEMNNTVLCMFTDVSTVFDVYKYNTKEELESAFYEYMSDLIKHIHKIPNTSENIIIEEAKKYIQDNFDKNVTLSEIANTVFVNPDYLCRIFKLHTGVNFTDYLVAIRMSKASELLINTNKKVHEICMMVGYKSLAHFHKLFLYHFGITPNEYRKQHNI